MTTRVRVGEDEGRRVLLVDDVVQSIAEATPSSAETGYWGAMVPDVRPERVLLLGLGAGTVARLIDCRFGGVSIVGVDDDPGVVEVARTELADLASLEIVQMDAFEFVQRSEDRFELACVDLYRGAEIQPGIARKPFLRRLRALLQPRGLAVFNLFDDRRAQRRLDRIGRVFRVLRTIRLGENLVVWAR